MNNVSKFNYFYLPYSSDILLITVVGKLLFKFIFYYKYPKALNYALQNDVELHLINYLEKELVEVLVKDESLLFFAPTNHGCDFPTTLIYDENTIPMRHAWEVVRSYIIDFFERGNILMGVSVENEVFVVNNSVVKIDKSFRFVSNSVDAVSNCLIKKFLNLLYCPEIVDLLIEKKFIKQLNCKVNQPDNLSLKRKDETSSETQSKFSERTESITSLTIMSSNESITNAKKFSNGKIEHTEIVPQGYNSSEVECQATGDIKNLQICNNFNDTKLTINSRIIKAQNWIKNNENEIEKIDSSQMKCHDITLLKNKKTKKNNQKLSAEKVKLQRYIVRKSELVVKKSTNNSSTNLTIRRKFPKTRFTVLKNKFKSHESPSEEPKKDNIQKRSFKSKQTMKPIDPKVLSSIRKDVLDLANELHQNYLKQSKSIFNKSDEQSKPVNVENNDKTLKKNVLLEEVRKRLYRQPIFKRLNAPIIRKDMNVLQKDELDTLHGLNSINSQKQDTLVNKFESTFSLLSSSDNLFNSSFLTTLDNAITSYKSIMTSAENSPCLNTCDLRDIHQISDQIHGLAQRELIKF